MLETVGELGYTQTSVEDVIRRGHFTRNGFYRCFTSKEQCFEAAYRCETERLLSAILEPCRSGVDWTSGLIDALGTALDFVAEHPLRAQALLSVGQGAEDDMAAVQQQLFERLTRALDSARRLPGSRHSAPPLTAPLMIGAIENVMRGLLVSGESVRAPSLLADLTYLIVQSYFDDEVAFAAMDAAKAR
ncbi:MAG TPA: TetR/AcrR family transcriptional regulator [Solirubrobacterales bacterium]